MIRKKYVKLNVIILLYSFIIMIASLKIPYVHPIIEPSTDAPNVPKDMHLIQTLYVKKQKNV
jgi:hypothetical protein